MGSRSRALLTRAVPVEGARAPVPIVERRPDGALFYVAGASRSGKSTWVSQQVAKARRLLVWDYPKGQWGRELGCRPVSDFLALAALVRRSAPPARIAFCRVSETLAEDFETWCRLAWVYVRAHGAPLVVEELNTVTHPGKAPPAWGIICRMGLGYGSDIYAVSHRPAESDKTALANASVIHCGRMVIPDDEVLMARYLRAPLSDVQALAPLDYLHRDLRTNKLTRGRVRI